MSVQERLQAVHPIIARAAEAVAQDAGASPVLRAVVSEFRAKSGKAANVSGGDAAVREAVIELEQAGDSAKVAAEADAGLSSAARDAVLEAHLRICTLKAEMQAPQGGLS